jgi:hypothetical protein
MIVGLEMSGAMRRENKGDFEVTFPPIYHTCTINISLHILQVLEKAADQIKDQLKFDEKFPDLRDRLQLNSSNISQQYYLEPYQSDCGHMVTLFFLLFSSSPSIA